MPRKKCVTDKAHWAKCAFDPSHKGELHAYLGIPSGKKIPVEELRWVAKHGPGLPMRRRAQAALNIHGEG